MEYKEREYPLFSACGLNCGLCPRYHTNGVSICPGCAGKGFSEKRPSCGVLSCCKRKEIEYCYLCDEYSCKKYDAWGPYDSFITQKNQRRDLEKAKSIGIEAYRAELDEKIGILENLLEHYDDGRRKSFFCVAVNLLELDDVKSVAEQLATETKSEDGAKEKAAAAVRLFEDMGRKRGMDLKLRKKPK